MLLKDFLCKAMRETNGGFGEYALSLLKEIDEEFYKREINGSLLWRNKNA